MEEALLLLEENDFMRFMPMIPAILFEKWQENTDVEIYGILEAEEAAGIIITERTGREVLLKYIFLREESRGYGIAARMMRELRYICYNKGSRYMTVKYMPTKYPQVDNLLRSFVCTKREEEVGSFYLSLGEIAQNWRLTKEAKGSISLKDCNMTLLSDIQGKMAEAGFLPKDFPLADGIYDSCSAVYLRERKAEGILLVRKKGHGENTEIENEIEIPLLVSFSENANVALDMMCFSIEKGLKTYPKETLCEIHVVNPSLLLAFEKLFGRRAQRRIERKMNLNFYGQIKWEVRELVGSGAVDFRKEY